MRYLSLILLASGLWAAELLEQYGRLDAASKTSRDGQHVVSHAVPVAGGQLVTVAMESTEFDACLVVRASDGRLFANNDWQGRNALLHLVTLEPGTLEVLATSARPGERGKYRVRVESRALAGGASAPKLLTRQEDQLGPGDNKLKAGEYADTWSFLLPPGQACRVVVSKAAFDTYLIVKTPSGEQRDVDAAAGTAQEISFVSSDAGATSVVVTSAKPGQAGAYTLEVYCSALAPADQPPARGTLLDTRGRLSGESEKLKSGEYAHAHAVTVRRDQPTTVRLSPAGFAGYVIVKPPAGQPQVEARAGRDEPVTAHFTPRSDGVAQVVVTTVGAGEQGDYRLTVGPPDRAPAVANPVAPPASETPRAQSLDLLKPGRSLPAPTPAAGTVEDPGVLAQSLHTKKYVSIVFSGVHQWHGNRFERQGQTLRAVDASGPAYQLMECYPRWSEGCPPLQWVGNTFRTYHETRRNGEQFCYEAVGTVSPTGDRLERIMVRTFQQQVAAEDADKPTGKLWWRNWSNFTLVDLPFQPRHWFAGTYPYTLAEALGALRREGRSVDREGIGYDSEGPDTRDHALEIRHLEQKPHYDGEPFIDPDYIKWREYQNTEWLNQETTPKLHVRFYNR